MDNINNEIYSMYLEMLQEDGLNLRNFTPKYQEEELCIIAVKQNGDALEFVENQTEEICMAAIKQNGMALKYVKEQTQEICLEAVKQNGLALKYVEEQTPKLCLEAVKQNGWALEYVKDQNPELCLEAVKQNESALQFVENQTSEICLAAIKQNCLALSYIKDKELAQKFRNELVESKLLKETNTYRAFITDGIDCRHAYISSDDNIERPVTIVLNTKYNLITISFNNNETRCSTKDILDSLGDYKIWNIDNNHVIIELDGLSDDKMSELFTDIIMKVDESVREHYDLSRGIQDKNIKDIDDLEL